MKNTYQNDSFAKKAKLNNLRARSYFKLEEIDKKYNFIKERVTIFDLGAAPGSWSQYCLKKASTKVLAIDLQMIEPIKNLTFYQLDVFDIKEEIIKQFLLNCNQDKFQVILSDMAPKTTGNPFSDSIASAELVKQVLTLSQDWLSEKGWLVIKFFEGEEKEEIYSLCKKMFRFFKIFVPKSTRSNSREVFLVMNEKKN